MQGRRRIKLGLKNVVNIGELTQHIDIATQHTVSRLHMTLLKPPQLQSVHFLKTAANRNC